MGLYLCVFDNEEEVDGVEIGSYSDFNNIREYISKFLEHGEYGSKYPVLQNHSAADGVWTPKECVVLEDELKEIGDALIKLPVIEYEPGTWQFQKIQSGLITPKNLYDCFFDVNAEPLIQRITDLAQLSQKSGQPILFQ